MYCSDMITMRKKCRNLKIKDMKEKDYILSAQNLFDFLCGHFGLDWSEVMNRQRVEGTLGVIRVQHAMFDMYKQIQAEDGFLAWKEGISILKAIIAEDNEWKTVEELRNRARFLMDAASFVESYEMVRNSDRQDWLEQLRSMRLLTPDEKQQEDIVDKCPRSLTDDIAKFMNRPRGLQICRYRGDSPLVMDRIKHINVGENFIMANNVGELMMQGKNGSEDELNIYVAMDIDTILDFSYFLIAFNNGQNWWYVTDSPDFSNPAAKLLIAGRGSGRYRENDFDNTIFPYIYLDHIEEWRKNNSQLDKAESVRREMYTVPLVEWPVICRVYLNLLIEQVMHRLAGDKGTLVQMKFGYEYTQTLLLENKTFNSGDWRKTEGYFDFEKESVNAQTRVKKMIFRENKETALVKLDSKQVMDKIAAWNGNLMTPDKFRSVEAWAKCETEAQIRRKQLEMTDSEKERDRRRMADMIDRNIHNRLGDIFSARDMYVFVYEPDIIYKDDTRTFNPYRCVRISKLRGDASKWWTVEVPGTVGGKVGDPCRRCRKHELKNHHKIGLKITHYAILAWLAGVKREQLPYRFVNYMSFDFESYTGNHLLNNVNPMYQLKDYMSRNYSNGFDMDTIVCRHCQTAMLKKAMDKAVLVINADTCESEGIFDMDGFRTFLKSKGINGCKQLDYFTK